MRELNLNEMNMIAGGVNPTVAPAVVVAPTTTKNTSFVSDFVSLGGLVAGAYFAAQVANIPMITYSVKGFDVAHAAVKGLAGLAGATLGYAAGAAYAKYGLTTVNSMI